MEPILLTPEAAAKALSVGRSRVYQLIARQELRSIVVGRSRRVPVEALREWVAEQAGDRPDGGDRTAA